MSIVAEHRSKNQPTMVTPRRRASIQGAGLQEATPVEQLAAVTHIVRPTRLAMCTKRIMDVTAAMSLLALLALPLGVIALLVKLTSRGPVFYAQERVGYRGRTFTMYKFRSMRIDAEKKSGPVWACENDPRCTRLGHFLRRTSLDELPQLLNVAFGQMSLVGPRPERPCFVSQFSCEYPEYTLRHELPPGLTGWAQICGWRGNTSLKSRLEHDLDYIRNWSLRRDLAILCKTPWHVWGGQNAC